MRDTLCQNSVIAAISNISFFRRLHKIPIKMNILIFCFVVSGIINIFSQNCFFFPFTPCARIKRVRVTQIHGLKHPLDVLSFLPFGIHLRSTNTRNMWMTCFLNLHFKQQNQLKATILYIKVIKAPHIYACYYTLGVTYRNTSSLQSVREQQARMGTFIMYIIAD